MSRRADRLFDLSTCRLVLRQHGLTSPEAVSNAAPEALAQLDDHRAEIVRLVREGHPDVLRALFCSDLDWMVAGLTSEPGARLLSVWQGPERVVALTYHLEDPDGERRAWRTLLPVLRAGAPTAAVTGTPD